GFNILSYLILSYLILSYLILSITLSAGSLANANEAHIEKTFKFAQPEIKIKEGYTFVTVKDIPLYGTQGEPVLPVKTVRLLIPAGRDIKNIHVHPGAKGTMKGQHTIAHGQKNFPMHIRYAIDETPPNEAIYHSHKPFPGALYSDFTIQKKMGYRILILNLHPVEYIPAAGKISYYEELRVSVETCTAKTVAEKVKVRESEMDRSEISRLVDNPEALSSCDVSYDQPAVSLLAGNQSQSVIPLSGGSFLDPSKGYQYIVITNQALKDAGTDYTFQDLLAHRKMWGIQTDANAVFTVEWIDAVYDGTRPDGTSDLATKIRNFITDAYNTWGTQYVLLGGDADGADAGGESGDNIVPARYLYGIYFKKTLVTPLFIPSDLYYACLDGTFDNNGNGVYGEIDDGDGGNDVDMLAEVFVGRAPVDSEGELSNFVRKTIQYDNHWPTEPYLNDALLVGEKWTDDIPGNGWVLSEQLIGICDEGGYHTDGIPADWDIERLYDNDPNIPNPPGEVLYEDHFVPKINNDIHLVNVMGHGNENSFIKRDNPDLGLLHNAKYCLIYSQSCFNGSFDNLEVIGNELDFYTKFKAVDCIAEHFLADEHGAFAFIGNSRFGLYSKISLNSPSQSFNREFYDAIFSEQRAILSMAHQDSREDCIGLAIVDTDYRLCYYELTLFGDPAVEVAINPQPEVVYDKHEIAEATGDGDGYMEPGETIDMWVSLINNIAHVTPETAVIFSTDSPYITITDMCSYFGVIPAYGTKTAQDNFTFNVNPSSPPDFTATFHLDIVNAQAGITYGTDTFDVRLKEVKSVTGKVLDGKGRPVPNVRIKYYLKRFYNDMESGASNWDPDPNWALITSDSHSPTHCWTDSPYGNFKKGSVSSLDMDNPIYIGQKGTLRFWHHYNTDPPSYLAKNILKVNLTSENNNKDIMEYKGTNLLWKNAELPLTDYCDTNIRIKFILESPSTAQAAGDGWYIDDVFIGENLGYCVTDPNGSYRINGLLPDPDHEYMLYADTPSGDTLSQSIIIANDIINLNFTFEQPDIGADVTLIEGYMTSGKNCVKEITIENSGDTDSQFILCTGEKEDGEWRRRVIIDDPYDNPNRIDISVVEAAIDPENLCIIMSISLHRPLPDINPFDGGVLYLDTDQNPSTGLSAGSSVGAEYILDFYPCNDSYAYINMKSALNNDILGILPVFINQASDQFIFSIPLRLIKDDGRINMYGMFYTRIGTYFAKDWIPSLNGYATINPDGVWLSAVPTQGTIQPSSSLPVNIFMDSARDPNNPLSPGIYEGMVAVSGLNPNNAHTTIPVVMKVYPSNHEICLFQEGFESGILDPNIWTQETTGDGYVSISYGSHNGFYSLRLGAYPNGVSSYARATLNIDLSKYDNPILKFYVRESSGETDGYDGVFISDDGTNWVSIYDYKYNYIGPIYKRVSLDLASEAKKAGMSLSESFFIRFQYYENESTYWSNNLYSIDDIEIVYEQSYMKQTIFFEDFESGTFGQPNWNMGWTNEGRLRINSYAPYKGNYSLLLDDYLSNWIFSYADAWICIDLSGYEGIDLDVFVREFNDETNNLGDTGDGIFISDDWRRLGKKVCDYSLIGNAYKNINIDIDKEAEYAGITLGEAFRIYFQFYGRCPIPNDGYAIDNVRLINHAYNGLMIGDCSKSEIPLYFKIHTEDLSNPNQPANFSWDEVTSSQVDSYSNLDYELEFTTYANSNYSGRIYYTYKDRKWTKTTQLSVQARMGCQSTFSGQHDLVHLQILDETTGNIVKDWHVNTPSNPNTWIWGIVNETVSGLDPSHLYAVRLYAYDNWNLQKVICRWEYVNVSGE
ncbi:hypothetical protein JXL19_07725, partial [bacterium]|nr:hypothetical protein [bacterium]